PGADATVEQLKAAQMLTSQKGHGAPVLKTSSADGAGIEDLVTAIIAAGAARSAEKPTASRRDSRLRFAIETAIRDVVAKALDDGALDSRVADRVARGDLDLEAAVRDTLVKIARG
ncbi:MAG: hypothetical protein RL291_2022, partial [Pseudomonadota bacterium]